MSELPVAVRSTRERWGWLAAACLVALVYLPVRHGEFVFDDRKLVVENEALWSGWGFDLDLTRDRSADPVRTNFRPVRFASYKLDAVLTQWAGLDRPTPVPLFFHLQNIFWHALSVLLVAAVTRRLWPTTSALVPLAAALAFGLHPVQTESVAYISGRRDVLFGALNLLALWLFLRARPAPGWGAALSVAAVFALALGAKEMAISLPIVLLAAAWLGTRSAKRWQAGAWHWPTRTLFVTGLVAAGFAAVLLGYQNPGGGAEAWGGNPANAFWSALRALALYTRLLVWPAPLTIDYSYAAFLPSEGPLSPPAGLLALLGCLTALGTAAFAAWRGRWLVAVGIPLFIAMLAPVLQIVPHPERVAERYLYWPLLAFLLVAAGLLAPFVRRAPVASAGTIGLLLAVAAGATLQRLDDWQSSYRLWASAVAVHPDCARAQFALATAAHDLGRPIEALDAAERALDLLARLTRDRLQQGYYLQALTLSAGWLAQSPHEADLRVALQRLERVLAEIDTDGRPVAEDPVILHEKLKLEERLGRFEDAYATAQRLAALATPGPQVVEALLFLAGNAQGRGAEHEAWQHIERAAALATSERQHGRVNYQRGLALQRAERWWEARAQFLQAAARVSVDGSPASALYLAAECLVRSGDSEQAADELRRLLAEHPGHLPAALSLADLELAAGNLEPAATWYRVVLQAAPHHERARAGLRAIEVRRMASGAGQVAEASSPQRATVLKMLGERLLREEQFTKALEALERADDHADGPDQRALRAEIRRLRARCLVRLERGADARAAYDALLAGSSGIERVDLALELAAFEKHREDVPAALAVLSGEWETGQRDARLAAQAGALAVQLRERDLALSWYRIALAQDDLHAEERTRIEHLVARLEALP